MAGSLGMDTSSLFNDDDLRVGPMDPQQTPPASPPMSQVSVAVITLTPLSQDGAEIKYTHMHTFTTLLLSVRMVLRLSIHTFARPVCLL